MKRSDKDSLGDLLVRVEQDLEPVRPLRTPWQRALVVLAWACVSLALVLSFLGLREDCSLLGPWLSWLPLVTAFTVAYLMFLLVGREAIPGAGMVPAGAIVLTVAAAACHFALGHFTYHRNPAGMPGHEGPMLHWGCITAMLVIGMPLIVFGVSVVRSGFAVRPWVAGLLTGAAAAVVADSVWRMHCPVTDPWHFLLSHSGPYTVIIAVGVALLGRRSGAAKVDR